MTPRFSRWSSTALLATATLLVPSCSHQSPEVTVFAAASLTGAFEELARAFTVDHPGTNIRLHFAGTSRLVLQLREGAPADVFASADTVQMQRVVDADQVVGQPTTFAKGQLVIVTAKDNPKKITSLADLQKPEVTTLLCGPNVPAGRYAREALQKAGVTIESKSDEPSVRAVLSKVQLGLVDAGIVYATDTHSPGDVHPIVIPAAHNITATYPIATLNTGSQGEAGAAFVAFVTSAAGQRILAAHGFAKP